MTMTQISLGLEFQACPECGIVFGAPIDFMGERRSDHKHFYCPNGHSLNFPGQTEAERLQRKLADAERRELWESERAKGEQRRADHAERRLAATKGVVTKMKKRVGAGVCPCCNRHFTALQRHMENQHPEFVKDEV